MSGHSKWANIRVKKGKMDALRGKTFTRVTREIIIAARTGGDNPDSNIRLRKAIEKAKESNLPKDNIEKAILRGAGKLPGVTYEEHTYEGYAPGGVAILTEVTTDNKQRTLAEIRHLFSKHGGNLGEAGCVAWMFKKKGYFLVEKSVIEEDDMLSIALDAGAEDVKAGDASYEITTAPEDFEQVKTSLSEKNITPSSSEITLIPSSTVPVEGKEAEQVLKLMESLEEHDDVKQVYANFDIPEKVMEQIAA